MVDLNEVSKELLARSEEGRSLAPRRSATRLQPGLWHLDYRDDEHVYLLSVQQVPRRRLGPEQPLPLGSIDGVEIALTGVVTDNYVHVQIAGLPGQRRDELARQHEQAFNDWALRRSTGQDGEPPAQPGERLMRVRVSLTDELGTAYAWAGGKAGGSGTEWLSSQALLPVPPPAAHQLHIVLQVPEHPDVRLDLRM